MNYQIGINISLLLSLLITVTIGFIYAIRQPWKNDSKDLPINDLYKFSTIGMTIAIFMFFSSFNLIYSIINGYNNFVTDKNDLTKIFLDEIKSGVFAQRLTSISLGASFFITIIKFSNNTPFPNDKKNKEYSVFKESEKYNVTCTARMNSFEFKFLGITQQAFYVFILSVLWLMTITNKGDSVAIYPMLLSYALFYIVDDWIIIFKYSMILKGNIINRYNLKIWVLNLIIVGLGAFSLKANLLYMIIFLILSIAILSYRLRIEFSDLFGQKGITKRT